MYNSILKTPLNLGDFIIMSSSLPTFPTYC